MKNLIYRITKKVAKLYGYQLVKKNHIPGDFSEQDRKIATAALPYTMTGPARLYALMRSVEYIAQHNISGAMVECGVWKGGSMMAVAKTLMQLGKTDRKLYLFDTFAGMPKPLQVDGVKANEQFQETKINDNSSKWANASLEQVRSVIQQTGYPLENVHFIQGKVEDTIPEQAPDEIALLRLDTDWYESTYHELVYLYPRLSKYGVLIIDDYGHWPGAKQATDEYIAQHQVPMLLNRIDKSARISLKTTEHSFPKII